MKKINSIYLIPLKYGGIGVLILMILFVILYYYGPNPLLIPPVLDFRIILFPIMLVFGIREFKEAHNGGILHFWQGASIGIQIILIITMVMGIFIYIFGGFIDNAFVHNYVQQAIAEIQAMSDKISEAVGNDVLQKSLKIMPSRTIADISFDYLLKSLPFVLYGVTLTIIISFLLRKKSF